MVKEQKSETKGTQSKIYNGSKVSVSKIKKGDSCSERVSTVKIASTRALHPKKLNLKEQTLVIIEDEYSQGSSHSTHFESHCSPKMNISSSSSPESINFSKPKNSSLPKVQYPSFHQNSFKEQKQCLPRQKISNGSSSSQLSHYQHYSNMFVQQPSIATAPQVTLPITNKSAMRKPAEYACFREVPCIYPSEADFKDPYTLFAKLYQMGYAQHGIIKIIPPKSWKPEYSFDKVKESLTTRTQILSSLSKAQPFSQQSDHCTYSQFKAKADEFKKNFTFKTNSQLQDNLRKVEYEFWERVEHPELFSDEMEDLEVEYAADLPSNKYGSAFSQKQKNNFHLDFVNSAPNSLFQSMPSDGISGITSPWVYLGMLFASFCWHVEDLYMCALNYHHMGEPKTWYGVPPSHKKEFEKVYREAFPQIFAKKPDVLFHLNLMFSPAAAAEKGIPIYRTDQKPGEFIFTFPQTYHSGFSHGFNCGEAVNVISYDWFDHYNQAVSDYAALKHPTKNYFKSASFAIEWLLTHVIQNLHSSKFSLQFLLTIQDEWKKVVKKEKSKREAILQEYEGIRIIEFANKADRYDRNVCCQCGYYMYYSHVFCGTCIKKSCLHHASQCKCKKNPQLFIRFTYEDFDEQSRILEAKIKKATNS